MATPTVVIVPGVAASTLSNLLFGRYNQFIWLDYLVLATGGMRLLELDGQGIAPKYPALVGQIVPRGILTAYYRPTYDFFQSKGPVLTFPYDWRKSSFDSGTLLASFLKPVLANGPVWIVAHSMGGLVARLADAALQSDLNHANLQRVIQIGTPNWGSWEAPRNLAGIASWIGPYARLVAGTGTGYLFHQAVDYLQGVICNYRTVMEMMPDGWTGPWANDVATQQLYTLANWAGSNNAINAYMLQWGKDFFSLLPPIVNPSRYTCVVGYGNTTTVGRKPDTYFWDAGSYKTSDQGDGTVAVISAALPDLPTIYSPVGHAYMPTDGPVLHAVWSALSKGITADVIL